MIRSAGEKMAKSVGNIFLLREVLDRYPPAVVLTYFLTTHYRSPLEFSLEKLDEAKAAYERLVEAVRTAQLQDRPPRRGRGPRRERQLRAVAQAARVAFAEHMDDDLNTAGAIGELFGLARELFRYVGAADAAGESVDVDVARRRRGRARRRARRAAASRCPTTCRARGEAARGRVPTARSARPRTSPCRRPPGSPTRAAGTTSSCSTASASPATTPTYACVLRDHYRAEKDWARADRLRDEIQAAGFEVRDTTQGTQVVPQRD